MDMYLSGGLMHDSLQDMLDCDIKHEIDTVLGGSDLSLSLGDLPPLELEDPLCGIGNDMPSWLTANGGGLLSHGSNSCQSAINGEFGIQDPGSIMVDPNHVMPVHMPPTTISNQSPKKDTKIPIKIEPEEEELENEIESEGVYLDSDAEDKILTFTHHGFYTTKKPITSITSKSTITNPAITTQQIQIKKQTSLLKTDSNNTSLAIKVTQPSTQQSGNILVQVHPQSATSLTHSQANKRQRHQFLELDLDSKHNKEYPKPAYSYSCLIAMALKNSSTGSLPVSEIYNFMCEHFPFFKTAPNGWKNSVRHNLSLNKCFEKIEKPAGNGSQRKGCLWAMNPAKIAKMDEEVHKWSKKDPLAIRKAMICPENLELLEKGELKRSPRINHTHHVNGRGRPRIHHTVVASTNNMKVCGGSEGDDDDTEEDEEEEEEDEVVEEEVDEDTGTEDIEQDLDEEEVDQQYRVREYMQLTGLAPTNENDSYDEASLTDFEIEVADAVYEELDPNDENLKLGVCLSSSLIDAPLSKRTKLDNNINVSSVAVTSANTIQGNYVYKPMVSWGLSTQKNSTTNNVAQRRKAPILLRTAGTASSLIKLEDP